MARTAITGLWPALLPASVIDALKRRLVESAGFGLLFVAGLFTAAILTYSAADPSFNNATDGPVHNLLGPGGAYLADLMLQILGIVAILPSLVLVAWSWRLMSKKGIRWIWLRLLVFVAAIFFTAIAVATIPASEGWPLRTGLGGVSGAILFDAASSQMSRLGWGYESAMTVSLASLLATICLAYAIGLSWLEWRTFFIACFNLCKSVIGLAWRGRALLRRKKSIEVENEGRVEPAFDGAFQSGAEPENQPLSTHQRIKKAIVDKAAKPAPESKHALSQRQGSLALGGKTGPNDPFQLPPLDLVEAPPEGMDREVTDKDSLARNAQLLETVLEDFGVKGEISKVRPGPVVTLYELEPAPGTKTSRVVGLADDIARSMSAVSVRIAVVPGRSVIGIELPNAKRDMVYFRELLAAKSFDRSNGSLTLALGKDIGGSPIVVDLARMPHLLIAGTTGSGKSVAINTMILSLLYRLTPEQCKFIMIDPKMLELSVYDGIPNLLTPVVTDPSKAVVALKWAVREMEERYRAMSQMGVRNIAGYNSRLKEARKKGEQLTRRVQTGFDEDGKPVYEDVALSMDALPMIVIVVDEMADLMMVAGKDIEAAIQRLAQMARAAGIHLIMATQRPSVDVITGTIKANFPTRISFQVTSKIDSRTILGEQGAEQLLGQGDMLYMAGGGLISRVHGPFVSDEEVEEIVKHLKAQADPVYEAAVTDDKDDGFSIVGPGAEGGRSGDDELYDEAVALVAREGKASTSFIQRHLQIGYNRAARIIEQMEEQNVVTKADRVGRRQVLIAEQ